VDRAFSRELRIIGIQDWKKRGEEHVYSDSFYNQELRTQRVTPLRSLKKKKVKTPMSALSPNRGLHTPQETWEEKTKKGGEGGES